MNIGFILHSYHNFGGVATWMKCLVPGLASSDTIRVGLLDSRNSDLESLGSLGAEVFCEVGGCRRVAWRSDVLVLWHLGKETHRILHKTPCPPAISVSHEGSVSVTTRRDLEFQAKWSKGFVYVAPAAIESIPERLRHLSTCIPNAPSPSRWLVSKTRSEMRSSMGVSSDDILLCAMTRITPEKGLHVIADAVRLLGGKYRFAIAGRVSGKTNQAYKDRLARSGVIVLPATEFQDLPEASDFVVSCSQSEANSYSLLESLLRGIPVVSTRVGLLCSEPQLARIAEPDAKSFADAIELDMKDAFGRTMRVVNSRDWVVRNANIETFVQLWRKQLYGLSASA